MYVIRTIVIPRPITMHIRVLFRTAFPFQFWASGLGSFNSLHMVASLNPQDLQRHTFCERDDFILLARTDTVLKLLGNHSDWLLTNDQTQTDLRTQSHIIDCYVSLDTLYRSTWIINGTWSGAGGNNQHLDQKNAATTNNLLVSINWYLSAPPLSIHLFRLSQGKNQTTKYITNISMQSFLFSGQWGWLS